MNNKSLFLSFFILISLFLINVIEAQVVVRSSARASASASVSASGGNTFFFYSPGWSYGYGGNSSSWAGSWGYRHFGGYFDDHGIQRLPRREGHDYRRLPRPTHYMERNQMEHEYIGPK